MAATSIDLDRFTAAQAPVWDDVLAELSAARKRTHWMWFVFPQLAALGRSGTAKFYGIRGAEEAKAYLQHPVLGPRLVQCCELLLQAQHVSAHEIFGDVDATKLRSCLTLFDAVSPATACFGACLQAFYSGERDPLTLAILSGAP